MYKRTFIGRTYLGPYSARKKQLRYTYIKIDNTLVEHVPQK
jgi:hypothetical protein